MVVTIARRGQGAEPYTAAIIAGSGRLTRRELNGRWLVASRGDTGEVETGVQTLGDGIIQIDLRFGDQPGVVAAFLLHGAGELALIEVGPTTTRPALEAGIGAAGFDPGDIDRLLVTHIHLDHAGAAGSLMRDHPRARLSVHPLGAPHLVDPSRLVASAARIYGDQMETLWGEVAPVPVDRIDVFADRAPVRVAGRTLIPLFTPGHASHHAAFLDEASGTVFTGDVGGVRIQGTTYVCPPTPPPDLDPDAWATSVETLRSVNARRLALTHFGIFDDVDAHLDQLMPNLDTFVVAAGEELPPDGATDTLTRRIHALERAALGDADSNAFTRLELATPAYMAALGLRRLLKQRGDVA